MAVDCIQFKLRNYAEYKAYTPDEGNQIPDIYTIRTMHAAPPTPIAFGVNNTSALLDKLSIYLALVFNHFPQCQLHFAYRRICGILVM